ncbi:MAG: penicillin acylase family protein [Alphaproteobacteria bacterium]|nr:penicillin acylase family protein [Alphaproteobacteria bacterium]
MRLLGRALRVLLVAAACLGAGAWTYLRSSLPQERGTITLASPAAAVEIRRDDDGLVRIVAASETDAYFALGFVHAQDRLAQMELQRRVGHGRLAEVIGPAGLESDRFMRTLGLGALAAAIVPTLPPETLRVLEAYAAGINGFLETRAGALPPEFALLRHRPEPWTAADSVLWGKLMALQLSGNFRGEALRARLLQRLTPAEVDALWPATGGPSTTEGASNAWIVGGDRTVGGAPILANDPHLGLRAPGPWHLVRIDAPGLTLAGATFPGAPFHILGHNGRVAWGMTTTNADVADLVVERLVTDRPDQYETPSGPAPVATREETILVRGGTPVTITVRATRHGPVVSDVSAAVAAAAPGEMVALQATYLQPGDRTADAFRRMAHARTAAEFREALRPFAGPPQNVHFADVEGAFGMVTAGRIPVRAEGEGWVPADGWKAGERWPRTIPFDELPQRMGRPYETIANANNRVVDERYPYFITREWDAAYRARRLVALLDQPGRHHVDTSAAIMSDIRSLAAADLLPILLPIARSSERTAPAVALLGGWDGAMDRDRPEPLIFTAWLRELMRGVFADDLGEQFDEFWDLRPALLHAVLTRMPEWCDDRRTRDRRESCADQASDALERAVATLAQTRGAEVRGWRWGDVHEVRLGPLLLANVPGLAELFATRLPVDGGYDTLNRAHMRIADEEAPFRAVHGAGLRAIYDLADLDSSRFMIAIGQSGNPLSPHFADLALPWRDFAWRTLGRAPRSGSPQRVLVLRPR